MEVLKLKSWDIRYDYEATLAAYAQIERGGTQLCSCCHCRNFLQVREEVYPKEFRDLLHSLGVDYLKEAEVYHIARLSPGLHLYHGLFYFVGTNSRIGHNSEDSANPPASEIEDFKWSFMGTGALAQDVFKGLPLVEVMFEARVPWVLQEEEPE
jgi:hypothetical protein